MSVLVNGSYEHEQIIGLSKDKLGLLIEDGAGKPLPLVSERDLNIN